MQALKQWAAGICVFAIIVSVVKTVSPARSLDRVMTLSIRLLLCVVMMIPLTGVPDMFENVQIQTDTVISQTEYDVDQAVIDLVAKNLKQQMKNTLHNEGVSFADLTVVLHNSEKSGIELCEVIVITNEQQARVEQTIQKYYGIKPTIRRADETVVE